MKMRRYLALSTLLLCSCGTINYTLDGQQYSGADAFQSASDALQRSTHQELVATMRVSEAISKKNLTIGIPTVETIKGGFVMPNMLQVTPAQLIIRDELSKQVRKEYQMFASVIRDTGIYREVKIIDSTGGHLQPAAGESVLYMYVLPQSNAFQWYINGGKTGQQTVNIDRGQPKFLGKATSYVNSVKGYALTD